MNTLPFYSLSCRHMQRKKKKSLELFFAYEPLLWWTRFIAVLTAAFCMSRVKKTGPEQLSAYHHELIFLPQGIHFPQKQSFLLVHSGYSCLPRMRNNIKHKYSKLSFFVQNYLFWCACLVGCWNVMNCSYFRLHILPLNRCCVKIFISEMMRLISSARTTCMQTFSCWLLVHFSVYQEPGANLRWLFTCLSSPAQAPLGLRAAAAVWSSPKGSTLWANNEKPVQQHKISTSNNGGVVIELCRCRESSKVWQ